MTVSQRHSPTADGRRPTRIPFPTVDEITRHCLLDSEPETVHIEIHLPRRPDPARLRTAVAGALRRHPRILMRQAPVLWWHQSYSWELTGEPDHDPVSYPGGTLAQARRRALTRCPSLAVSPPIRIEVVEHDGAGVLLVTVNHTALDGPACLRVLATAAELYGQRDNSPTTRAGRAAANGASTPRAPTPTRRPRGGSRLRRPARIAAVGGHPDASGNGMLVTELPLPTRWPRHTGHEVTYTVNDQLLTATWITAARWNRAHKLPTRPIRVTMPVDHRARTTDMPIGNGTRLAEVTFGTEESELHDRLTAHRTPEPAAVARLLHATALRTRALKAAGGQQLGISGAVLTTPLLPVALRATCARALRAGAGPWTSTTLLSNIGRLPYPMDFGDAGRARAVWFSAPARQPRGLSVTTVSTDGRLQLALRWSRARLSDTAGHQLAELFAEAVAATAPDAAANSDRDGGSD